MKLEDIEIKDRFIAWGNEEFNSFEKKNINLYKKIIKEKVTSFGTGSMLTRHTAMKTHNRLLRKLNANGIKTPYMEKI